MHSSGHDRFCDGLKAARHARSLSIEDIAQVTRISKQSLLYLEAGRFAELPAEVYVRGFVQAYAQAVGLDPAEVLAEYKACGATRMARASPWPGQTFRETSDVVKDPDPTNAPPRNGVITLMVLVFIIAVGALTLSHLLRPASSRSDGYTWSEEALVVRDHA